MFDLRQDEGRLRKQTSFLQSQFFYLLCSLNIYFLGSAMLSGTKITNLISSMLLAFFIIVCIFPFLKHRGIFIVAVILASIILSLHCVVIFYSQDAGIFIVLYSLCALFLSVMTYAVIYTIIKHQIITIDSLFGAICGYFLIGFTWTFFYMLINTIYPASFPDTMLLGSIHDKTQHFFYYSFTTMTTLGFGDVVPLSNVARTFSWLEAVFGQIYLAVWISQLVGLRIAQEIKQ